MSLQDANILQLDLQSLSLKNKELSKTVVRLKQENTDLQNELYVTKKDVFEYQSELNNLRLAFELFETRLQLCLPMMKEIADGFHELFNCCSMYKCRKTKQSVGKPVVRLERMNLVDSSLVSKAPNSNNVNYSFGDLTEIDGDIGDDINVSAREPSLSRISERSDEEGETLTKEINRSSSLSRPPSLSISKSSLSPLNCSEIPHEGINLVIPLESTLYFQTPSLTNIGDRTELKSSTTSSNNGLDTTMVTSQRKRHVSENDTPLSSIMSPTEIKRSLGHIKKSLRSLKNEEVASPQHSVGGSGSLGPKRLIVEVRKLRDSEIKKEKDVERNSLTQKKNSKKSAKRKGKSSESDSSRASDAISEGGSPKKRPRRAARPGTLKEPSLTKKMRRSK